MSYTVKRPKDFGGIVVWYRQAQVFISTSSVVEPAVAYILLQTCLLIEKHKHKQITSGFEIVRILEASLY